MTSKELPRVWLITGSSTGFGRALAEAALAMRRSPHCHCSQSQQNSRYGGQISADCFISLLRCDRSSKH